MDERRFRVRRGGLLALAALLLSVPAAAAAPAVPRVVALDGQARLRGGAELAPRAAVPWGSEVLVAAGATLELSNGADFALKIWGPTALVVKQTTQTERTWVDVLYGRLIAAFRPGAPGYLSTRSNVAGVRGTVVYLEDSAAYPDYTCLCEGELKHTHRVHTDVTRTVEATHHAAIQATTNAIVDAPMANHGDDDVAAVKALLEP